MIIDSHVHVWTEATDPRRGPAPWPARSFDGHFRAYALDEVEAEMTAAGVTGIVLVQATHSLQHTNELLESAARAALPTKVVGWVPLDDPQDATTALRGYTGRPELVGVRQWHLCDDPEFLLSRAVTESLRQVAAAGLSLDILPSPLEVLDRIPELARRHPDLPMVVNLLGWPHLTSGRMQPWTDQLAAAAALPNVHVKLGGLYLESDWHPDPEAWRPYVATVVDLFGAERIMIGANWPVMTMFGRTYGETIAVLKESLGELIDTERDQVLGGTAARVYQFDDAAAGADADDFGPAGPSVVRVPLATVPRTAAEPQRTSVAEQSRCTCR